MTSSIWTAYDVLSVVRNMLKTDDAKKLLIEQGRSMYKLALTEIVTLLNGAVAKEYRSFVEAYHQISGASKDDNTNIPGSRFTNPEKTILVEDDILLSSYGNIVSINLNQKRVVGEAGSVNGIIHDPLCGRRIDRIMGIEHRVEGIGELFTSLTPNQKCSGEGIERPNITFTSILSPDFESGSYEKNYIYSQFGGNPVPAQPTVINNATPCTAWTQAAADSKHLPSEGTIADVLFPSEYIRIRKSNKNQGILLRSNWTSNVNFYRVIYTIWYQRSPNFPMDNDTDSTQSGWDQNSKHPTRYVDLPDRHVPLLFKRMASYCMIQLNQVIPDGLIIDTARDLDQIYAYMDSETRSQYQSMSQNILAQMSRSGK